MRNTSTLKSSDVCGSLTAIFCFLLLLCPLRLHCQDKKIDSLKALLSNRVGAERYDIICELGYATLVAGYYGQAVSYSDQLLAIGKTDKDSLQTIRGWAIKASVLRRSGFIDSAKSLYSKILPIARRHQYDVQVKDISNSLGVLLTFEGHYDKALEYLFESLEIRERQQDKFETSVALQNIGLVYYKLGNLEKALSYNRKALKLQRESMNLGSIEILLINIGLCHSGMKDFSAAKKMIDEAFFYCRDGCDDHFFMSAHYSLGFMLYSQLSHEKAALEFLTSYSFAQKIDNVRYQLDNLAMLAEMSLARNNLVDAGKYLLKAEEIVEKDDRYRLELLDIYLQFSGLYKKLKRYKEMCNYQEKYIALKNNIFSEEVTSNLMKAEAQFVEREKQAQIESQNKILALNEELIFRQRIANGSIGVVAVLVLLLAAVLAKNNHQKRIANRLLDERVTQRTRELEMNRDALQRAWSERDRLIAKASSDIRGFVATIKGLYFLALKDIDHPNAPDYLNKMNNASDQLSEQLGKMSNLHRE